MSEKLHQLANAFHAAAEQMAEEPPMVFAPNMHPVPEDPAAAMSRKIAADVLKAIGDVYMGQAVN